jgi:hypothetical protein
MRPRSGCRRDSTSENYLAEGDACNAMSCEKSPLDGYSETDRRDLLRSCEEALGIANPLALSKRREPVREHSHGEKEPRRARYPSRGIGREAAAGYDAVHMRMKKSRFAESRIVGILKGGEGGVAVGDLRENTGCEIGPG